MHISQDLISGSLCPITAAVSGLFLAGAAWAAYRSVEKPHALRFAAVSALVFAAQMMNFPISGGTSGQDVYKRQHVLGAALAARASTRISPPAEGLHLLSAQAVSYTHLDVYKRQGI